MFIPGPDLITRIISTDSQHIRVTSHGQRKSLILRQGGPVILSGIDLLQTLQAGSCQPPARGAHVPEP